MGSWYYQIVSSCLKHEIGWGNGMMGNKEGTLYNEHWELYTTDETLNSTPKLIIHYMLTNLY